MKNNFNSKSLTSLSAQVIKAVKESNIGILQHLICIGADINEKDKEKNTPLIWAALNRDKEIAEFLIVNGADINAQDSYNNTALIFSIACGEPYITKLLLDNKADQNIFNKHEENALTLAVSTGKIIVVEMLIKSGADINIKNSSKKTIIQIAKEKGYKDIERFIIDHIEKEKEKVVARKNRALSIKKKLFKQVSDPSLKRKLKIQKPLKFTN